VGEVWEKSWTSPGPCQKKGGRNCSIAHQIAIRIPGFADVLLMKAEALGFDPFSVDIINRIRTRAGAGVYPGTGSFSAAFYQYPASGTEAINPTTFLTKLLDERRIELAFENHRLFVLTRTGQFVTTMQGYYASEYDAH
jgi:starch-binding outer membrane protein, SusD/RagB family